MKTPKQIKDSTMLAFYAFAASLILSAIYLIIGLFILFKNAHK